MKKLIYCAGLLCLGCNSFVCAQQTNDTDKVDAAVTHTFLGMDVVDSKPLSEVWIDSGFATYHFNHDEDLNGNNYGLGGEYRFSTVAAATIGRFYNSNRAYSDYAGVYYQPLAIGPFRIGAVAGGFNGYPNMKNGGWFLAALPVVSADWNRFGINLAYIPTLSNRLYGGITLQVKIKVWD